jgi:glycosyltransferase involved in cell wall biosynthesis
MAAKTTSGSHAEEGRTMRIALVISALSAGGAERVIVTLANCWAARGWGVTLITFEPPGTTPYYPVDPRVALRQLGIASVGSPLWRAIRQNLRRIRALRHALRAAGPDLAIAFLAKINVLTVLASRGLGFPVVVSERNNPERQRFRGIWSWLRQRLYGTAYCVVAPSRGVLESFSGGIRRRGRVIPNPVDLTPAARAPRGSGRLVAVGRLAHQKGFDLLLQAFAEIAPAHPAWTLTIWGEGEERAALEALRASLGLAERVRLPGLTERPGQWVEDADIFVLSSRFEGFPNVIAEAMAAGLPVIAFDCPWGTDEIVRDGEEGLLVPREDVQALAAAMRRLMGDPELRHRLGEAGGRNVRRFGKEAIVAQWDALIRAAVAPRLHDEILRLPDAAPASFE